MLDLCGFLFLFSPMHVVTRDVFKTNGGARERVKSEKQKIITAK